MKRILSAVTLLLCLSIGGYAQGLPLRESTPTEVLVIAQLIVDGHASSNTGSIPTGFSLATTKQSDTGVISSSRFTPTLATGLTPADHSCYALTNGYQWACKLSAADTDTQGRFSLCWSYPGAYDDCQNYTVISQIDWDLNIGGDAATNSGITDIQGRLPSALTADGNMKSDALRIGGTLETGGTLAASKAILDKFGFTGAGPYYVQSAVVQISNNTITAASMASDAVPLPVSTAYTNFTFPMFDSLGALKSGLTVSCVRYLAAVQANCDNAVAAVGGGIYKINFSAADTANVEALYIFTATGARVQPYHIRFQN